MSHIGKNSIKILDDIKLKVENNILIVNGRLGELKLKLKNNFKISIDLKSKKITIIPLKLDKKTKSLWGLYRTLINNMIVGVSQGFLVKLKLVGIGYRASISDDKKNLILRVGFSHEIFYKIPENINIICITPTLISIFGINRQQVNQIASEIRSFRKPEPYKGKGIRYENEIIQLKQGKKK